jgi:hypothetical protein
MDVRIASVWIVDWCAYVAITILVWRYAARSDDTQLPRDQEPTDGERVGPPTEETCTAC